MAKDIWIYTIDDVARISQIDPRRVTVAIRLDREPDRKHWLELTAEHAEQLAASLVEAVSRVRKD